MTCVCASIRNFSRFKKIRLKPTKFFFRFLLLIGFCGTMLKAQINDGLRGPTRKQRQTSDKPRRVGDRRLNTNKNFWQSPTITNLIENSVQSTKINFFYFGSTA